MAQGTGTGVQSIYLWIISGSRGAFASRGCNRLQPKARKTDTSAMFITPIRTAHRKAPAFAGTVRYGIPFDVKRAIRRCADFASECVVGGSEIGQLEFVL